MKDKKKKFKPIKIDILGTKYIIKENRTLIDCQGYCDYSGHIIEFNPECICDNPEEIRKKTLRHEIIHAYLSESGLTENWEHKSIGQEETVVDWFAFQSPKIFKTFKKLKLV